MSEQEERLQMVKQQVRAWSVLEPRVLDVMAQLPRAHFVPEPYRHVAYADTRIPLDHGEEMLSPKLAGRILQALEPQRRDSALEIGTGSGYLTACLAQLTGQVHSVEIHADLSAAADRNLKAAQLVDAAPVELQVADASALTPERNYDVIALTCSLPLPDERFERALAPGGRLFVVLGEGPCMQATLVTRSGESDWVREVLFETTLAPMHNARTPSRFQF